MEQVLRNFIQALLVILVLGCSSSDENELNSNGDPNNPDDTTNDDSGLPLDLINLPSGFKIEVFASQVENARSLAISPNGTVFVGNRSEDKVYALQDTDGDFKADEKYVLATGLRMPNGVAFKDGDLYVAEVSRILKFGDIEIHLDDPRQPEIIFDGYPTDGHHGWKFIAFGPDGKLYVPVGAPCNICETSLEVYASITRLNPDGSGMEVVAQGIRNTVGFDWHPQTGELWFTDNGRDFMDDETPPCELNKVTQPGMHFGYPYCHGGTIKDPEFGDKFPCSDFVEPQHNFRAHTSPLGMRFYTGNMFPSSYQGNIFLAQHGSWNRSTKIGYRLMLVKVENGQVVDAEVFADGWLDENEDDAWGRPVDVLQLSDGSLLVSDDQANAIYRISYEGS